MHKILSILLLISTVIILILISKKNITVLQVSPFSPDKIIQKDNMERNPANFVYPEEEETIDFEHEVILL